MLMFEGAKSIVSVIVGLLLVIIGIIPLLNTLKIISFSIPTIPQVVLLIILAAAGYYLFIDGIFEFAISPGMAWLSMGFGLLSGTGGMLKLLNILTSVVGWIQGTAINILFVIIGILLIIGAFMF